jgi:site-specific recombinase XerC
MIEIVYFLVIFCFLSYLTYEQSHKVKKVKQFKSCSLEVRNNKVPSECCLFLSKKGKKLSGAALNNRIAKLKRSGIII